MAGAYSKVVRSYIMSHVPTKNTTPEMIVRKFLHSQGFRYRLHPKNLPGKPDIVLPKYKIVIFVNGCFWHGHFSCKEFRPAKTNIEFWNRKIQSNVDRDKRNFELLTKAGWNVITIWECGLGKDSVNNTLSNLVYAIKLNVT